MGRLKDISSEEFKEIIESSFYMVDVLEKLGYCRTSGTMTKYIKNRIIKDGLSTAHFIGQKGNRGGGKLQRYTLEEILVVDSNYHNRGSIKKRILSEKLLEEQCAECGILPIWNEKKLSLHLDHINGVYNDHRIENLRFLCPNCHSQTETYSGRNIKKKSS